ncbi:MAG TPA: undecaprenyl-diphosphatase UppP [Pantanalinema sp.]
MDLLQSVVLGVVQGITEFLPVSSTAHLILVPWFMNWRDPGLTYDVVLQGGTFLAVIWYFWTDIRNMLWAWIRSLSKPDLANDPDQRLAWLVILGSVPAGVAGVLLEKHIETTFRSPYVIAATLIGVGLLLALAEVVARHQRELKGLRWLDALVIGIGQACALIPGTSRSGATMTAAMFMGFSRTAAARFSFLLGIPIIFASTLFKVKHYVDDFGLNHPGRSLADHLLQSPNTVPFVVGTVVSTVVGYLSIRFLLAYLQRGTMWLFIGYRLVLGALILVMLLTNRLPATMHVG